MPSAIRSVLRLTAPATVRGLAATRPAMARAARPALALKAAQWRAFTSSPLRAAEAESEKPATDAEKAAEKDAATAGDDEIASLRKLVEERESRIKELENAVLYTKADMQNLERRSRDEKAKASDYGITKLAKDLTSSLDVLQLALKSVPETFREAPENTSNEDPHKAVAELYSGVALTQKAILDMLKMHGITAFDPTGEPFDPNQHEALYQAPVPGKEPGTVLSVSKVGYRIKDRILRPAEVGVVQDSS